MIYINKFKFCTGYPIINPDGKLQAKGEDDKSVDFEVNTSFVVECADQLSVYIRKVNTDNIYIVAPQVFDFVFIGLETEK